MDGILVAYARCSTRGQDLRAQRTALRKVGVAEDRIYTDAAYTGRNTDRPGLTQALAAVRQGDTLVVTKLDRLGRSILDLHRIANELTDKGVKLSRGGTTYNPNDPAGKLFFSMLAAFAEFESDLIRTIDGMAEARKAGRLPGKQPKLTALQRRRRYDDYQSGKYTTAELMELYPPKRSAIYATINREHERRELAELSAGFAASPSRYQPLRLSKPPKHWPCPWKAATAKPLPLGGPPSSRRPSVWAGPDLFTHSRASP